MSTHLHFTAVSRAARALLGSGSPEALELSDDTPAATAAEPAPVEPLDPEDGGKKRKKPVEEMADDADANASLPNDALDANAIRGDERNRVSTVFASEHATGRERQAADMLQTSMSAAEITGLLAKAPKGTVADPMLAALTGTPNPDLGAGAETPSANSKSTDAIWDNARVRRAV